GRRAEPCDRSRHSSSVVWPGCEGVDGDPSWARRCHSSSQGGPPGPPDPGPPCQPYGGPYQRRRREATSSTIPPTTNGNTKNPGKNPGPRSQPSRSITIVRPSPSASAITSATALPSSSALRSPAR